jgi:hypothetical protein
MSSNLKIVEINPLYDPKMIQQPTQLQVGGIINPENLELELEEYDFQDTGNPNDFQQDPPAPDDKEIDLVEKGIKDEEMDTYGQSSEERKDANYLFENNQENQDNQETEKSELFTNFTSHWKHPELGLDSQELSEHLKQEQIKEQVDIYVSNYYSTEYQEYLDKLNYIYSKIGKKYYIRHGKKGDIYLLARNSDEAKHKDISPVKTIKELEDEYLIKLEPPKYISISKTLELLDFKLRRASVNIHILQNELLAKGGDITDKDIERFKRKKRQFFQLVNRKQIYINYYYEINNINRDDEKIKWNAKRLIERDNASGEKIYFYENLLVDLTPETTEDFKQQFKEQFDIYSQIYDMFNTLSEKDRKSNPEYDSLMKEYLNKSDKLNQLRNDKVKEALIKKDKKIDFLVETLPVVIVRKNIS